MKLTTNTGKELKLEDSDFPILVEIDREKCGKDYLIVRTKNGGISAVKDAFTYRNALDKQEKIY